MKYSVTQINKLIPRAASYADQIVGLGEGYTTKQDYADAWDPVYYRKMDELAKAAGIRDDHGRWDRD